LAYTIEYSPATVDHLAFLTARQRSTVFAATDARLMHETRNRKPMRPNQLAPWELRVGALRIYYDVEEEPERKVLIRAVGIKERNRVRIGGQEFEL
jgi:mRNA-degrading endonuclease RelE of RelBE toxin-antitoxin system